METMDLLRMGEVKDQPREDEGSLVRVEFHFSEN